jgi:hypothetical protein
MGVRSRRAEFPGPPYLAHDSLSAAGRVDSLVRSISGLVAASVRQQLVIDSVGTRCTLA